MVSRREAESGVTYYCTVGMVADCGGRGGGRDYCRQAWLQTVVAEMVAGCGGRDYCRQVGMVEDCGGRDYCRQGWWQAVVSEIIAGRQAGRHGGRLWCQSLLQAGRDGGRLWCQRLLQAGRQAGMVADCGGRGGGRDGGRIEGT
ncbi:hypothetical protein Pcinc_033476 [Petrolisthes cinctipes]|uniref:Uncharacterized protein n=1 Tax=Petrolisthes cinctipes TaxID=88211 RepID=A0AAE1ES29_PETCI|nr:hypothetical protein Pcinc_033476 [Petrolisthes cinctipes]